MKKLLIAVCLCASTAGAAQNTYFYNYDLNVPTIGATTNRIVTSVNLPANGTLTIANQPDVPRNITITVTDTMPSVNTGTVTVTCVDVNGSTITEVLDLSAALTLTGTKVCASVTSVVVAGAGVLGGGGDETIIVGVGAVVSYIYCEWSDWTPGLGRVQTTGSSTTINATSTEAIFGGIAAGDEIATQSGTTVQRRIVSAVNSTSQLVVTSTATWTTTGGLSWSWRDRTCGYSDTDGWMPVNGLEEVGVKVSVGDGSGAAVTATGGVDISLECLVSPDLLPAQVLTINWPITTTLRPTSSDIYEVTEPCSALRVGLKFGTVDTTGTDSITAYLIGENK